MIRLIFGSKPSAGFNQPVLDVGEEMRIDRDLFDLPDLDADPVVFGEVAEPVAVHEFDRGRTGPYRLAFRGGGERAGPVDALIARPSGDDHVLKVSDGAGRGRP